MGVADGARGVAVPVMVGAAAVCVGTTGAVCSGAEGVAVPGATVGCGLPGVMVMPGYGVMVKTGVRIASTMVASCSAGAWFPSRTWSEIASRSRLIRAAGMITTASAL